MPTCPVFTRAKIKSRFGILVNLPSQYIYGNCVSFCCILRKKNVLSGWCGLSLLLNFSENEAFAREALVLGEISFFILLFPASILDVFF